MKKPTKPQTKLSSNLRILSTDRLAHVVGGAGNAGNCVQVAAGNAGNCVQVAAGNAGNGAKLA